MKRPEERRQEELLRWGPRLARRFAKAPPRDDDLLGATVAEAIRPPKPSDALASRVPEVETVAARAGSQTWLARMVRVAHQPPAGGPEWLGLRSYLLGQDVLLAGWTSPLRALQVASTRERMHVCTSLAGEAVEGDEARVSAAATLAEALFEAWFPADPARWWVRRTGSWTYAVLAEEPATSWAETVLVVSDGVGVKFSFVKDLRPDHPAKGERAGPDLRPWFTKPVREEA